jgi:Zn-dependent protease
MLETTACEACGTEIAPGLLACPGCQRLVHSGRLKELAAAAKQAERGGDPRAALVAWREALELLPVGTRQHAQIVDRITALGRAAEASPSTRPVNAADAQERPGWSGGAGVAGLGAIGLFLFKFKFVLFFLLTKAKFLLLGLTKASTFFSMLLTFGLYLQLYGWKFGLGLVLSIYVHEMGHVYMLNRYGIKASAPMFIPGFGALVRLQQAIFDVRQDARVGLAGPVWGMGAAICCLLGSVALGSPVLAATAKVGAFVNLFNLIPVWQLDGGRAFRALTRPQRWLGAAAVATAWAMTDEGLLFLLMLGAAFRAIVERGPAEPDRGALLQYVSLVAGFSALLLIPVAV